MHFVFLLLPFLVNGMLKIILFSYNPENLSVLQKFEHTVNKVQYSAHVNCAHMCCLVCPSLLYTTAVRENMWNMQNK